MRLTLDVGGRIVAPLAMRRGDQKSSPKSRGVGQQRAFQRRRRKADALYRRDVASSRRAGAARVNCPSSGHTVLANAHTGVVASSAGD